MIKKRMLLIGLSLCSSIACANFQKGADALLNKLDPNAYVGVSVVDLTTGAALYQRHDADRFIPASNMKLFSDAAALMALGPDYHFTNRLSTNAKRLQQGVLDGSLYLYLSGDPSFSHQRLQHLLHSLSYWQIRHIQGNIVIDSTHAVVTPAAPGWVHKDLAYSYGAPLGPVMVDANRLQVTVNPGDKIDSPAVIEVADPSGTVHVVNQVVTKASPKGCGVGLVLDSQHRLLAQGCIGKGQWALQQGLAIQNPLLYLQGILKKQLASLHIVLDGQVVLGSTPPGSLLLGTEQSKPVAQLLSDTLKPSDNLYADSLFLHAAAVLHGTAVNWQEAQLVVKAFLQEQTGIDFSQAALVDGSGLSRDDRVTPKQTTALLQFLYNKFPLTYEYIAALPVSGRDGTLATRLKAPTEQDFVRAKTGTMTGVSSLSGYMYTENGHTLAFSVYSNRRPKINPRVSGRTLIDALCGYFLKQQPGNLSWATFFKAHQRLSFQQHLTQSQTQRLHQARWRGLESAVKMALGDQAVGVVYRPNELLVLDDQADPTRVYRALQTVVKQHPFALAVSTQQAGDSYSGLPAVLVMDGPSQLGEGVAGHQRVWVIRESV
ncbi:MAG: D-alanyl-D-alanine carboxypeptidase/D-alanyl-D-alanine-endopeptidase [Gammaproteobacteria bacterium]|nr:D-alanyl-D-alanine carboxypeptidase/D-alanyl-D-alanine-endopeptidase [Gammaproteobacteria bacterium]